MKFALLEGLKNIVRAPASAMIVSVIIGTALLVGSWFFMLTVKLQESSDYIEQALEMEAFLDEGLSEDVVDSLQMKLNALPEISEVGYISKDSAAAIFLEEVGEDIVTLTGENPLPASFRITFKADLLIQGNLDSLTTQIDSLAGVDEIVARRTYLLTLLKYRETVWIIHISAASAFLIVALFVIINVIKLSIFSRRESIEIMKLIGATNRFINAPFIVEGAVVGLIGGLIGILMSEGFSRWLNYMLEIELPSNIFIYPAMFCAGLLASVLGSIIAVHRFIRKP